MKYLKLSAIFALLLLCFAVQDGAAQNKRSAFKIARVKYSGGGDWYNDPSAEANLLQYVAKNTNIPVDPTYEYVDLASDNLFTYPLIFLTGHGNINFTDREAKNLREYLDNGGFLFIDDDYGLNEYIRKEMKKVYPDQSFAELPFSHGIYKSHFEFGKGMPKTHEHDNKPPQGFGLFSSGRLCVFYCYESNISDGWADPNVHKDDPETRDKALKMGVNIIVWALTN
jgi:hypothetical protein